MKKRIISVILALALLFVCACGGSGKNKDSGDTDTSTDSDISDDADNDSYSDADDTDDPDDGEGSSNDSDTRQDASLFDEIVSGLDDSFLEPNKGFALKIAVPLLQSMPDTYDLADDEYPYFISGSVIDEKGRSYPFNDNRSAFAADYQGYLYLIANSGYTGNTYYSASIMVPYSSFDWMFQNDVDEIGPKYFYVYLFRTGLCFRNSIPLMPEGSCLRQREESAEAIYERRRLAARRKLRIYDQCLPFV